MISDPISLLSSTELSNLSVSLKEAFLESIEYLSEVSSGNLPPDSDRIKTCQDILDRVGLTKKKSIEIDQTIHSDLPPEIVTEGLKSLFQSMNLPLPSVPQERALPQALSNEVRERSSEKSKEALNTVDNIIIKNEEEEFSELLASADARESETNQSQISPQVMNKIREDKR